MIRLVYLSLVFVVWSSSWVSGQVQPLTNFGTDNTILNFRWADSLNDSVALVCTFNPRAIWRTDGTSDGTFLVKEFAPWANNSKIQDIVPLGVLNGKALFIIYTEEYGNELWAVDPLGETCNLVVDLIPGTDGLTPPGFQMIKCRGWVDGDVMYFTGLVTNDVTGDKEQLVVSTKGDAFSTSIVMRIPGVLNSNHDTYPIIMHDGNLYTFILRPTETVCLRLNPTQNQVDTVFRVDEYQDFMDYSMKDGHLMMICRGFFNYHRFWFYDFASNSLEQFDISSTQNYWSPQPSLVVQREFSETQFGIMFSVKKFGTQSILYRSDGTPNGTIVCLDAGGSSFGGSIENKPNGFVDLKNDVYLYADQHFFRYNPTDDVVLIRYFDDECPTSYEVVQINEELFLPGYHKAFGGDTGFEPYIYSPQGNTWELLEDLNPGKQGSNPIYPVKLGADRVVFIGFTAAQADELFVYNGKMVSVIPLSQFHSLSITPNPVDDLLTISGLDEMNQSLVDYRMLDAQGRLIEGIVSVNSSTFSVSRMPPGLYYLQLQFEEGSHTLPFIKQ